MSDDDKRPPDAATRTLAGPRTLAFPKVRLKVLKGPDKGMTVTLVEDEILIGGADSAQLRLTDPTVSRNHCVIRMTAKGPLLRDLASTNGSRIDGVEVREAYVPRGATLELGHTQVRFEPLDESVELPLADSERFGRLWGRSTAMRRLFALAGRVAASDVTVLIEGETGTGKDALAEAIHQAQHARGRPADRRRLRRRAAQPVRVGAVRPRARRLHRRRSRARGRVRGGRRRHAVSRRDRRAAAAAAAEAAARAGGARGAPHRLGAGAEGERPRRRGHQPRPARGGEPRQLSGRTSTSAWR